MNSNALNAKYQSLPVEIQQLKSFVLFKHHVQNGEVKKRPYDWRGGKRGNDDPTLWLPMADAISKMVNRSDLGLAIYQSSSGISIDRDGRQLSLCIIDCDGFVAEIAGQSKMIPLGWDLIDRCKNSYAELSMSYRGIKLFVLTDMKPQGKLIFKLPANEFAEIYPDVKKYRDSHAVEVFFSGFWNALTGEVINSECSNLQFVPREELQEIFDYLASLAPQTAIQSQKRGDSAPSAIIPLPDKLGLIEALSKIDNQSEAIWNEIAWSLARVLGIDGLELFVCYSRGDYNGKPYPEYDEATVRDRYRRALDEVQKRPQGFGLGHLSRLSGIPLQTITRSISGAQAFTTDSGVTASELATKTFPPLEWVVDGVLPEGCYLLSARPKVGKSWLALQIC